jgi:hypothetical protein
MKKYFFSLLMTLLAITPVLTKAQTAKPAGLSDDYKPGFIINSSNTKVEGFIRESLKGKGTISFATVTGAKKNYSVNEINEFSIADMRYIVYMNDFYQVVATGSRGNLYKKATDNSGKMLYNGSDAVPASTTEGRPGDFYLQVNKDHRLNLVTKKNFETVFATYCADCAPVQSGIKSGQLDYARITEVVEQYNKCN